MLKTRSLLPYLGKYDVTGKKYGSYLLRLRNLALSREREMMNWHAYGLSAATQYVNLQYYAMGIERLESTEKFYLDNYCKHRRIRRVNLPYTYGYEKFQSGGWRISVYPFSRYSPATWVYPDANFVETRHAGSLGQVGSELRAEAYWDMRPKFEGEVSMLNFLYELKDFRSICKLLSKSNNSNPLWALANTNKNALSTREKAGILLEPLSSPTKTLAELHLVNSFALQPLMSDCASIISQAQQMVDDAQSRFAASGAGTTRHWSKQLDPDANLSKAAISGPVQYWVGSRVTSTYTATAKMKYNYTPRGRFEALCKFWGFDISAEAIWNGVPFSFLFDYFISIGKSLKRMRTDENVTQFRMSNFVESVSTIYENGRYISQVTVNNQNNMGIVLDNVYHNSETKIHMIDGYDCSIYQRMIGIEPYFGPALPKLKVPTGSQLANMAALVRCML